MATPTAVHPEDVREVHRRFVTGVTLVTVDDRGTPRGLAVNAFSSISLEPPLVMVCVQRTSSTYPALLRSEHFAVNILAADQVGVAGVFAGKSPDKFASIDWSHGPNGAPLIDGCCAAIEVRNRERLQASTHTVFIGRVVHAQHSDAPPLIYRSGAFFDPARLTPLHS